MSYCFSSYSRQTAERNDSPVCAVALGTGCHGGHSSMAGIQRKKDATKNAMCSEREF